MKIIPHYTRGTFRSNYPENHTGTAPGWTREERQKDAIRVAEERSMAPIIAIIEIFARIISYAYLNV